MLTKEQLVALTPTQRMDTKATEIAKFDLAGTYVDKTYGVEIEVVSVTKIDKGVEVLARAWKDGKQLGFGPKGQIDIERFRIINPPVSVPDGTFTKKTFFDPAVKADVEYDDPNYKVDPEAALKEAVASIVSQVGKDGGGIVKNLVGSTTTTVYATYDAYLLEQSTEQTWAAIYGTTTGDSVDTTDNRWGFYFGCGDVTDRYNVLSRHGYTFDTSSIPDTDTISAATFSVYGSATTNGTTFTNGVVGVANVYDFDPTSATTYATSDFNVSKWGSTAYSTGISQGSWSASAYNDFAFNATGISGINKTGNTVFGIRDQTYDAANSAPTWEGGKISRCGVRTYTASGTTNDPKLVITHAAGGATANTGFFNFMPN